MALNNVIRSASRVVPLAIRASVGTRWSFHRHYSSALCATVDGRERDLSRSLLERSFPSFLHQYSTETSETISGDETSSDNEASPDEKLIDVLKEEISIVHSSHSLEEDKEIPEGFPFKIEDNDGTETIKLIREYRGETISVEVHMPNLVKGGEEEMTGQNQCSLPLVVKTSKRSGPYLEFGCTAFPGEISINSFLVKDPEISDEEIAYQGPDIEDLDEKLVNAFYRYLDIRGINASTINFLHGYMIEKDTRIYLEWLKKVDKFLEA